MIILFLTLLSLQAQELVPAPIFDFVKDPPTLSKDFLEKYHLIEYPELEFDTAKTIRMVQGKLHYVRAPLGRKRIVIGNKDYKQNDWALLDQYFHQKTFATIPLGSKIEFFRIEKEVDSLRREKWVYPVGTLLAHEIKFNSLSNQIYELRIVWKDANEKWHFATYLPSSKGFELLTQEQLGERVFDLEMKVSGKKELIRAHPVDPTKCSRCHRTESLSFYQYPEKSDTGPCGFVAANPMVRKFWVPRYQAHFNTKEDPFVRP